MRLIYCPRFLMLALILLALAACGTERPISSPSSTRNLAWQPGGEEPACPVNKIACPIGGGYKWGCFHPNHPNCLEPCEAQCPPGATCCNGKCKSIKDDPMNCGGCNKKCQSGAMCCNGTCKLVKDDPVNCGGCNKKCQSGATCCNGTCKTAP